MIAAHPAPAPAPTTQHTDDEFRENLAETIRRLDRLETANNEPAAAVHRTPNDD
jgi:hypothetical protein